MASGDLFLCRYTGDSENFTRKDLTFGPTWSLCEMIRDLKIFSVSSMISSTDIESEDSSLNRQVSINRRVQSAIFRGSYLLRPVDP